MPSDDKGVGIKQQLGVCGPDGATCGGGGSGLGKAQWCFFGGNTSSRFMGECQSLNSKNTAH